MVRTLWGLVAVFALIALSGCAATQGEVRAAAEHDLAGPRAEVSVAARW